jgi:hypothetical protein
MERKRVAGQSMSVFEERLYKYLHDKGVGTVGDFS